MDTMLGTERKNRKGRQSIAKLALIKEVYEKALKHTESFGSDFGSDLAYLLGEIANDGKIELSDCSSDNFRKFLETFPKDHRVHTFTWA